MKEKVRPDQELICINVDKVYDWVLKENTFDFTPQSPLTFPSVPAGADFQNATYTCEVRPVPQAENPVVILDRVNREFIIDGKRVCLQQLTIRKRFRLVVVMTLPNGEVYRSTPIDVARSEQVILCAPEDTEVTVTYTDLDCFVSSTGTVTRGGAGAPETRNLFYFSNLVVTIRTCQSIQSTFPVTVEFLADFCHPRAELAIGSCPLPSRPPQCHSIFPE
ncbi:hypothetical protein QT711_13410 [Sporosarcina saromensis]|uniref:Uncharacterized protein n=1 Tax=Sporosarcina saromensis TaxID=359365 RepID=A0ABU4GCZ3_9BACL|nr:hypothetical protein [Sporosarcina saromensis]MDW0114188.1 hypothetical protein [Sporosarcina saromensis]